MYENPLTNDLSKMDLDEVTPILANFNEFQNGVERSTTKAFKAMWYDEETTVTLNQESGYHFLTNSDYQVAMNYDGKLSMFISCGECGREEFEQDWDLENGKTTCEGCKQIVKDLLECEQ
jgi:formylmethanofuran dehydrogenase subunit E